MNTISAVALHTSSHSSPVNPLVNRRRSELRHFSEVRRLFIVSISIAFLIID